MTTWKYILSVYDLFINMVGTRLRPLYLLFDSNWRIYVTFFYFLHNNLSHHLKVTNIIFPYFYMTELKLLVTGKKVINTPQTASKNTGL